MSALPWIAVGLGAGGLFVLWQRSRAAKAEVEKGVNPCDALEAAGVPRSLCNAGLPLVDGIVDAVVDLFDGIDYPARDANNKKLNGDVELELGAMPAASLAGPFDPNQTRENNTVLKGTVARFKNGCVPFEGAPGWEKCATGTQTMHAQGAKYRFYDSPQGFEGWEQYKRLVEEEGRDKPLPLRFEASFTGERGDPFTAGPWRGPRDIGVPGETKFKWVDLKGEWAAFNAVPDFPLPLESGEVGYYCAGKPIKCPADRPELAMARVRDARTGAETTRCECAPIGSDERTDTADDGNQTVVGVESGAPTKSYEHQCDPATHTWDRAEDGTPFCRRLKPGESPAPPPGGDPLYGSGVRFF